MQECFRNQDLEKLENLTSVMNSELFEYHMKRCTDAGLWEVNEKNKEEQSGRDHKG